MAVLVRSDAEMPRAIAAVKAAGMQSVQLDSTSLGKAGSVAVSTMHEAKGLEFRAVSVAACDDEIIPLQSRIEVIVDEGDLEDVYNTERHLLYAVHATTHRLASGQTQHAGRPHVRRSLHGVMASPAQAASTRQTQRAARRRVVANAMIPEAAWSSWRLRHGGWRRSGRRW
jgi:superfamily I DNA/RNA helicase